MGLFIVLGYLIKNGGHEHDFKEIIEKNSPLKVEIENRYEKLNVFYIFAISFSNSSIRGVFAQISQNPKTLQKYNKIIPMHIPHKVVQ